MAWQVENLTSIREDAGWIPGLSQWVEDLVLLQGAAYVADWAWIGCCPGCGLGQQLQLQLDPQPGELPYATSVALKKKSVMTKKL